MSFAGVAIGAGVLKGVGGILQSGKGRKMAKRLIDPGYKIPKGFAQNLAIAENLAQSGMPAEQYNKAQQDINRAGTAGVRAIGRSSNPSAGVASLFRGQTDAFNNLNVANANARRQNILNAMGYRRDFANQELAKQQYGQQKYFNEMNQANALKGAGMQNMFGGLTDIGSAAATLYGEGDGSQTMGQKYNLPQISRVSTPQLKAPSSPPNSTYKMPANVTLKTK
jgi:hypothetical protein